jgi:hypothetical protein
LKLKFRAKKQEATMRAISIIKSEHKNLGAVLYSLDKLIEEIDDGKQPDFVHLHRPLSRSLSPPQGKPLPVPQAAGAGARNRESHPRTRATAYRG